MTSQPIYRSTRKLPDGAFDWSTLPQHYPVWSYARLPTPSALQGLPRVQHAFELETDEARIIRQHRQLQVRETMSRCWQAYRSRAWLTDELTPISGGKRTTFGGWAATLVDSLDTLWITGLENEFWEAANATLEIDFSTTSMETINVFETVIRYLGGFLAAFDLSGDVRLLDKGLELAEMVYHAFDTPNRLPLTRWKIQEAKQGKRQEAAPNVLSAEIGSLELELTRLTQITGDPRWYDAGKRIMDVFKKQQGSSRIAGMWPLAVNAKRADFATGTVFTLGAMADSLYEYLPKMDALLGGSSMYKQMYSRAMDAAINYSLFRPMLPDNADILLAGQVNVVSPFLQPRLRPDGQHLSCFAGAMFALGGRLLQRPNDLIIARKLTDGCIWAYEHTPLGIMPESFTMAPCIDVSNCVWNETEWKAQVLIQSGNYATNPDPNHAETYARDHRIPKGFTSITDRRYLLRPEAIESVFYLYRITGDPALVETAWRMFESIRKHTLTEFANAALADVTDESAPKVDSMESFWPAETLKYFYLIFSEPEWVNLNDWVLSTEAHPFRRPHNTAS